MNARLFCALSSGLSGPTKIWYRLPWLEQLLLSTLICPAMLPVGGPTLGSVTASTTAPAASVYVSPPSAERCTKIWEVVPKSWYSMYTWEGSLRPSSHMRSSNGTPAVAGFGVLKASAWLVERLPVTSAALRLTTARFGMLEFEGSGAFTATSPSPPPGANPLELQNGVTNMPQSG